MRYCKTCLTTDLRPNGRFFADGNCAPCHFMAKEGPVSWSKRLYALTEYIRARTRPSGQGFDCIVGVSGGKDSTRQALWVRDRLKMKPLLVCIAYPPLQMTDTGAANLANLVALGFDCILVGPAPQTSRDLTKRAFFEFGNVNKATEYALFSQVPRIAIDFGVNLIFWGENPALQVGDQGVISENMFDGNNLRGTNTLTAGGMGWVHEEVRSPVLAQSYEYPSLAEFQGHGIQIIYLGPAWSDWSMYANSKFAALSGLTIRERDVEGTGDVLRTNMLDENFSNINMMIKYYKFGFGRATDYCCDMIRMGRMTRQDATELVEKHDGVCSDEIIREFCQYVDISESKFWSVVLQFCNRQLFAVTEGPRPRPLFTVGVGLTA